MKLLHTPFGVGRGPPIDPTARAPPAIRASTHFYPAVSVQ